MADIDFKDIKKARVFLRERYAGSLEKKSEDEFVFQYDLEYLADSTSLDIARTLKKQNEPYKSKSLHPFFDNLITEGWLLQCTEKVYHIDKSNRFALLMATGRAPVGAVTVRPLNSAGEEIDVLSEFEGEFANERLKKYPSTNPENFPYCTTCYKPLGEGKVQHKKCLTDMWGTTKELRVEMDADNPLSTFARVIYGGSISGAQKKGMFRLDPKEGLLRATPAGAQFILKPNGDYPELPENEHVTMAIAKAVGFNLPPFALLNIEGLGHVFAIKRFDRLEDGTPLMMEDMGQIIRVPSTDKYESSYEKVAAAINEHSSAPQIDISDFYRRLIFCYFVANADMHLKNWTLLENEKALGTFELSPCYDLLNTRMPIPGERIDIGLKMLGKDRHLQASYFRRFGAQLGLSQNKIDAIFNEIPRWLSVAEDFVAKSLLKDSSKDKYIELVRERVKILTAAV